MKKTNSKKILVTFLLLNLTIGYSSSAHAGLLDTLKEKSAKLLEKSKEIGSKALEKGKEITITVADYASEKYEESKEQYEDIQKKKQSNSNSSQPEQATEKLEELPKDSQVSLDNSRENSRDNSGDNSQKNSTTDSKNNNQNSKVISTGSNQNQSENSSEHLGTISEKNPNPSQSKISENNSAVKKIGLFPWENEQPRFQSNTQNTVYNSLYSFRRNVKADTQWALIQVTHQSSGKSEDYILQEEGGQVQGTIAFKYGAGDYSIAIHETASSNRFTTYYKVHGYNIKNLDTRDLLFLQPSTYAQSTDERIIELAKEIVAGAKTQREAAIRINNWLAQNIEYDWAAYRDGSYINKDYSALATIESRVAVCQGFANLFAALARASGIKAKVVSGLGVTNGGGAPHAWNHVLIDGQWLNIDATWDQNLRKTTYLFMSDEKFNKTHQQQKIDENF